MNKLDRAFPFERFDSFFSIICMTIDIHEESIQKMVEAVYTNVNEFRHPTRPDDDISILGVEYCGQS